MNIKNLLLAVSLMIILVVAGCTSASSSTNGGATRQQVPITAKEAPVESGEVKELTIDTFNWGFTESDVQIKEGDKVRLTLTSSEGTHGVTIPELGISTGPVSPGDEQVVEFIATVSGNLGYYCNVPCGIGHSNMRGQLSVN